MGTRKHLSLVIVLVAWTAVPAGAQWPKLEFYPVRTFFQAHPHRIYRGVFSPDSQVLFTGGLDHDIRAWDVSSGKQLYRLAGHECPVHGLGVASNKLLISAGEDGTIYLWDTVERRRVGELPTHKEHIHCLAIAHDGKWLATGGGNWKKAEGELRLWDVERRQELAVLSGHRRVLLTLAFSRDQRWLAAGDAAGDVRVWDLSTHQPVVTLHADQSMGAVEFSPDGQQLLTGDYRGRITVWDTRTWTEDSSVHGQRGAILSLACAPESGLMASGGWDGQVKFWNRFALEEQLPLQAGYHKNKTWMVAFSPNGRHFASVGEDGFVRFRAITPKLLARHAAPRITPLPIAVARKDRAVRLALLAGSTSGGTVQDLALVQLSDLKGVELLERTAVEKLLREQKLSLSGLVEASTAIQVGKLLEVDLLGAVVTTPAPVSGQPKAQASVLGFILFDAATGVRLVDIGFTGAEAEQQARDVAAGVRSALVKWHAGQPNLRTLCFLPARNADLPRYLDLVGEALAASLQRQLVQHPDVVTLERKWLEHVTKEKALTGAAPTRELLASVLLLQLEIGRGTKKPLRATVFIRDNAGQILHTITEEGEEAAGTELLIPLTRRVQETLKTVGGTGLVKRGREARRFLREAEILWGHRDYRQGLQAAEASYALRVENESRLLLANYLMLYAWEQLKPGSIADTRRSYAPFTASPEAVRAGLALMHRAYQLIDAGRSWFDPKGDNGNFWSLAENGDCFHAPSYFLHDLFYLKKEGFPPDLLDDIRAFRQLSVQRDLERLREVAGRSLPAPQVVDRLNDGLFNNYIYRFEYSSPDAATLMNATIESIRLWLDRSRGLTAQTYRTARTEAFAERVLRSLWRPGVPKLKYSAVEQEKALALLRELQDHPHPVIGLHASLYEIQVLQDLGRIAAPEVEERCRRLLEEGKRWVDFIPYPEPNRHRAAFYGFLDRLLRSYPGQRSQQVQFDDLAALVNWMLERNDVVASIWSNAAAHGVSARQAHPEALPLIQRMLAAYHAPKHRLFDDRGKYLQRSLDDARRLILALSPELNKRRVPLPWERAIRVAETRMLPEVNAVMAPILHKEQVYFIAGGYDRAKNNQPRLQLVRAPLDGSGPKILGQAHATQRNYDPKQPEYAFWNLPRFVSVGLIHGKHYYAGTVSDGIYAFPLAGGPGMRIGEKEGLPGLEVLALVAVGNTLVASLEEGYLVTWDIATRKCAVMASSRRLEKLSPFDNDRLFRVWQLVADPERQRVLFLFYGRTIDHPNTGLWEYSLQTQRFTKLSPLRGFRFGRVENDVVYLEDGTHWLGKLALATNRFTLLRGESPPGLELEPAGLPKNFTAIFPGKLYFRGYLWEASPFGRRPLQGGPLELYPHAMNPTWPQTNYNDALEPISRTELLLSDWRGVYVIRLRD